MTRAKFRWILLASRVVMLFASLPTICSWRLRDAAHAFNCLVQNREYENSCIAMMPLGAQSHCNPGGALIPDSVHGAGRTTTFRVIQEEIQP
jgi:hypothetical protein